MLRRNRNKALMQEVSRGSNLRRRLTALNTSQMSLRYCDGRLPFGCCLPSTLRLIVSFLISYFVLTCGLAVRWIRQTERFSMSTVAPPSNLYVSQRDGQVLGRWMGLKSDDYPSDSAFSKKLALHISGAPNFRQIRPLTICGVGQPSLYGIRTILNLMKMRELKTISSDPMEVSESDVTAASFVSNLAHRQAVWINLREEPVVYLNNRPFVLRELDHPFKNMHDFKGIGGRGITLIEKRLKNDILREGSSNHGNILVHDEVTMGELRPCWEAASKYSVQTSTEVYEQLQSEGYWVEYKRVPMTADSAPDPKTMDSLVTIYLAHSLQPGTFFIYNCQRGMGRSTLGMIIMFLLRVRQFGEDVILGSRSRARAALAATTPSASHHSHRSHATPKAANSDGAGAASSGNGAANANGKRQRPEFEMIVKLVRLLKNGLAAKRLVDIAVEECGLLHNLYDAIVQAVDKAETARHADRHAVLAKVAAEQLKRYFYLICFQAYLLSVPTPEAWDQLNQEIAHTQAPHHPAADVAAPAASPSTRASAPSTMFSWEGAVLFPYTFESWMAQRPELQRLADLIEQSLKLAPTLDRGGAEAAIQQQDSAETSRVVYRRALTQSTSPATPNDASSSIGG